MSRYLLISSRDPFECGETEGFFELASNLGRAGHTVKLLLVQNGVGAARRTLRDGMLQALHAAGVNVLADDFSLRERALPDAELAPGVEKTSLDLVIDEMVLGTKTIWH